MYLGGELFLQRRNSSKRKPRSARICGGFVPSSVCRVQTDVTLRIDQKNTVSRKGESGSPVIACGNKWVPSHSLNGYAITKLLVGRLRVRAGKIHCCEWSAQQAQQELTQLFRATARNTAYIAKLGIAVWEKLPLHSHSIAFW